MTQTGAAGAVRVLHVVYAMRTGGMELGVVKLVNALNPQHVVSAICSTRAAGSTQALVREGIPTYELGGRAGNDPAVVLRLYRVLRETRPHVVHTHAWGTLVEGLLAARLARVPIVVHGEHGTLQLRPYQRRVQRWAWGAADHVLSVSTRLAERMSDEIGFPLTRIHTIRNGVDLSRFGHVSRARARAALNLDSTKLVVATVGRLVPVKDQALLIEALAGIRRTHANALLLMAGDGPLRVALGEQAHALGLDDAVRFLGHRPDVETVLAAADVFALPSESEGLSNTILEAMASGLPVVATRVGGADEMIRPGENGWLVTPRVSADLARRLGELLGDPARRRAMGTAGRARAESEFSLAGMIRRYEALYLDAVRARAPKARNSGARAPEAV